MIKTIGAVFLLTAVAAAAAWSIDLPPRPDALSPAELRERAARMFPGWPPPVCRF